MSPIVSPARSENLWYTSFDTWDCSRAAETSQPCFSDPRCKLFFLPYRRQICHRTPKVRELRQVANNFPRKSAFGDPRALQPRPNHQWVSRSRHHNTRFFWSLYRDYPLLILKKHLSRRLFLFLSQISYWQNFLITSLVKLYYSVPEKFLQIFEFLNL